VYGKEIKWQREANNEPVGQLSLEKIDEVFNQLNEIFQNDAHALNIIKELREVYTKGQNLSESTRNFVQFFFEKHGVVIMDAHHKSLKKCFSSYLNKEIRLGVLNKSISNINNFLIKNGFKVQATPRNINLFYFENHKRYRLELLKNEKIALVGSGKVYDKSEMLKQVEKHPERFSPNVLMRPVYQEVILPNIAYIGGSGEIAYWLQLKDVFKEFQVPFPLLMVRNSIFYAPPLVNRIMDKYDLKITDFFRNNLHKLLNRIVLRYSDFNIEEEKTAIEREFQKIKEKVLNIDMSLEAFLKGESVKLHKQLENIEKKALKAEKRHHETMNKQLEKVYQILFPEGQWQERVESFLPYYFKNENIIDDLINQTESLESNVYVFEI
jgi:bacillithiol biosynthesis cysteine-adding enzyme BshC